MRILILLFAFAISAHAQTCTNAPVITPIDPLPSNGTAHVAGSLFLKFDATTVCPNRTIHSKAGIDITIFPPCSSVPDNCIGEDLTPPGPYVIVMDTTRWANGPHTVKVEAYDQYDASASYSLTVSIENPAIMPDSTPPQAFIQTPIDGTHLGNGTSNVTVTGSYADNFLVDHVDLLVNGQVYATVNSSPWSFLWIVKKRGTYQLQTRAWDAAGNSGLSQVVTVTK